MRNGITTIKSALDETAGRREKLSPDLRQIGKAKGAVLEAAVGEGQAGANDAHIRSRYQGVIEQFARTRMGYGVRIEKIDGVRQLALVLSAAETKLPNCQIVGGAEADI